MNDLINRKVADIQIQAMLFNMDIDWELLELIPKETYKEPFWLSRWKDKMEQEDFDTNFDIDQE